MRASEARFFCLLLLIKNIALVHNASLRQITQEIEAENAGVVSVREMKVQSVTADNGNMAECYVSRNALVLKRLLTSPFVDTARAGAAATQLNGGIARFGIV